MIMESFASTTSRGGAVLKKHFSPLKNNARVDKHTWELYKQDARPSVWGHATNRTGARDSRMCPPSPRRVLEGVCSGVVVAVGLPFLLLFSRECLLLSGSHFQK